MNFVIKCLIYLCGFKDEFSGYDFLGFHGDREDAGVHQGERVVLGRLLSWEVQREITVPRQIKLHLGLRVRL